MAFSLIVCISQNNVIGRGNQLIYHIKEDLQRFKALTQGKVVIMGKNTYKSIGKALPNRFNIVLTSDKDFIAEECKVLHSLSECLVWCSQNHADKEWFIIGGGKLYQEVLDKNLIDKMYITKVHETITDGDTYFPNVDWDKFRLVQCYKCICDDGLEFDYLDYILKN